MLPSIIWNLLLTSKLPYNFQPEVFWDKVPTFISIGESVSRVIVFLLAAVMVFSLNTKIQRAGLVLYIIGVVVYFISWLSLIYLPNSEWSTSVLGFMAPAYTPLLWLFGIGLLGDRFYFQMRYSRIIFITMSSIFLGFHNIHTFIIYNRMY